MQRSIIHLMAAALAIWAHRSTAQWQQVPIPYEVNLYSLNARDPQHIDAGGFGCWLRSSDGGSNWDSIPTTDGQGFHYWAHATMGIAYASPTVTLSAGSNGLVPPIYWMFRTADDGTSWAPVYSEPSTDTLPSMQAVVMASGSLGVAVGSKGRIVRTTDSGQSFNSISSSGADLYDVAHPGGNVFVAVGGDIIRRSTDGGNTWQSTAVNGLLRTVSFPTASIGFAGGHQSTLFRTDDGGASWQPVDAHLADPYLVFRDLWFTSPDTGYAAVEEWIMRTVDGGAHWEYFPCTGTITDIHFEGASGIAVGSGGTIYRTAPGAYHPIAVFDVPQPACDGAVATFINQSDPALSSAWYFNGVFAGNANDLSGITLGPPSQVDTVMLVVSNGSFSDTLVQTWTVTPMVEVELIMNVGDTTICAGATVAVTIPGSQSGTVYSLRNGTLVVDGPAYGSGGTITFSTEAVPLSTLFNVLATRTVTGCGSAADSAYFQVIVNTPDVGLFVAPDSVTLCTYDTLAISMAGSQPNVSYQLRRNGVNIGAALAGTGDTLFFILPPGFAGGTYSIRATHTTGCASTLAQTVNVLVQVPAVACGLSNLNPTVGVPVEVMNGSFTYGGIYAWDFGPNATPSNSSLEDPGSVVFSQTGTQTIQLVGTTPVGCLDTALITVHVIDSVTEQECTVSQFTSNYGGPVIAAMTFDGNGNVYAFALLGHSMGITAFSGAGDTLSSSFVTQDPWDYHNELIKYDRQGVVQWIVHFLHGSGWARHADALTDPEGNVYAAYFHQEHTDSLRIISSDGSMVTMNPPHTTAQLSVVVTKFDPQGRLLWVQTFLDRYLMQHVNMERDAQGDIVVAGYDRMVKISPQGQILWQYQQMAAHQDVVVDDELHPWVAKRDNLVLREHDAFGAVLDSTMEYVPIPLGGLTSLATQAFERDEDGGMYASGHLTSGQVTVAGTVLRDPTGTDTSTTFIVKFDPEGEALWAVPITTTAPMILRGLAVDHGRVVVRITNSQYPDLLKIQGLPDMPMNPYDDWLCSFDLSGGTPWATRIYAPSLQYPLSDQNTLAWSPTEERLGLIVPFGTPTLYVGGDSAVAFTSLPGHHDFAVVFGEMDCIMPGIPPVSSTPQSYFTAPPIACVGEPVTFTDASWFGPTSWDWQFPGGTPPSSTDESPTVTYALPGDYPVSLIASNANGSGPVYTYTMAVDICTQTHMQVRSSCWSIWTSDQVLRFTGKERRPAAARCLDATGRVMWNGIVTDGLMLDVRDWPSGLYVFSLNDGQCDQPLSFVLTR